MSNRRILFFVSLVMFTASGFVTAQPVNNDYYQARSGEKMTELLASVEKYHEQQGIDKMRTKIYPSAWGDFNFILNYFPNHPRALMLMGSLCEVWQDPVCNMTAYFDKAIRLTPDNAGIYLTQGVYQQKRGKLKEAIESYKKSLELNPGSANAHYNIGLAYVATKQYALANEHAHQAYAGGISLPGLQNKLVTAKAWKPIEPKPAPEPAKNAEAEQPQAVVAAPDEPKSKPTESAPLSNDGGK